MKTLKTNIIMIITTALFFACGSDDNNNPETGEEIWPISELAENPDFIKFMELYYFTVPEIPDVQAAYDLYIELGEPDSFNDFNEEQFERYALTFGYGSAAALEAYLKELNTSLELLEKNYALTQADTVALEAESRKVFDELLERYSRDQINNSLQNLRSPESDWNDSFVQCWEQDYEDPVQSCTRDYFKRINEIYLEYYIENWGIPIERRPDYNFDLSIEFNNRMCCMIQKCFEVGEDHDCCLPAFAAKHCVMVIS